MPVSYPIKHANGCAMKELRPGSQGRSEVRILYAFDQQRTAVLLLGGDKALRRDDWRSFYDRNVPIAERRFAQHQALVRHGAPGVVARTTEQRVMGRGR
jgi:hypothetical protein